MFRVERLSDGLDPEYDVWDDQPGGRIVERWEEDGVKYVGVEFKHSPGVIYTYLARKQ